MDKKSSVISAVVISALLITGLTPIAANAQPVSVASPETVETIDAPVSAAITPVTEVDISSTLVSGTEYEISVSSDLSPLDASYRYVVRDSATLANLVTCYDPLDCAITIDSSAHPSVYAEVQNVKSETLELSTGIYTTTNDAYGLTLEVDRYNYTTTPGAAGIELPTWTITGQFPSVIAGNGNKIAIELELANEGQPSVGSNYPGYKTRILVTTFTESPTQLTGTPFSATIPYGYAAEIEAAYSVRVYRYSTSSPTVQTTLAKSSATAIKIIDYYVEAHAVAGNQTNFAVLPTSNNPMWVDGSYPNGGNYGYSFAIHEMVTDTWKTYSKCGIPELTYKIWCGAQPNEPITMSSTAITGSDVWIVEVVYGRFTCDYSVSTSCPMPGNGPFYNGSITSVDFEVSERSEPLIISKNLGVVEGYEALNGYNPSDPCYQLCAEDPVNTATGEYWETITDIEPMNAFSPPLTFARNYGSQSSGKDSGMGLGWTYGFGMKIQSGHASNNASTLLGLDYIGVLQENGSSVEFRRAGNTYGQISTTATMKHVAGKFIFSRQNGSVFEFDDVTGLLIAQIDPSTSHRLDFTYDSNGHLMEVEASNGQTITVGWTGSHITSVDTSTGLSYDYEYTGNLLTKVTDYAGRDYLYTYNSTSKKLITKTDPNGGVTTNVYDATSGKVTSQTDPMGGVATFSYATSGSGSSLVLTTTVNNPSLISIYKYNGATGRITSVSKGGYLTSYSYYATGELYSITNPSNGGSRVFTYDAKGNVLTSKNELGQISTAGYNVSSLPTYQADPLGNTSTVTYDSNGVPTSYTSPNGAITDIVTSGGLVQSVTSPLGNETSYTYDTNGFTLTETDPEGNVTTYTRDSRGRVISITDALGGAIEYTYDDANNLTLIEDEIGAETSFAYDAAGNILAATDNIGNESSYEYDLINRIKKSTDAVGNVTTYAYTANRLSDTTTYPNGMTVTTTYAPAIGAVQSISYNSTQVVFNVTNWRGQTTFSTEWGRISNYTYDLAGNMTQTVSGGTTTNYGYDTAGRNTTVTQVSSTLGNKVTTIEYDVNSQVAKVIRPDSYFELYEYDLDGRQTKFTDASGNESLYEYDANSRLVEYSEGGLSWQVEYNDLDAVVKKTNVNDLSYSEMEYNSRGLLTEITYSDSTPDVSYTYDTLGRVQTIDDTGALLDYNYNPNSQVISSDRGGVETGYSYDNMSRLSTLTYPSGLIANYGYNALSQLASVSGTWGSAYYTYNGSDIPSRINYNGASSGLKTELGVDIPNGRVGSKTNSGSIAAGLPSEYSKSTVGYNNLGLVSSKNMTSNTAAIGNRNTTYTYDTTGRLATTADSTAPTLRQVSFNLDDSITKADTRSLSYSDERVISGTGDFSNRSLGFTTADFEYDTRGNRTQTSFYSSTTGLVNTEYGYNSINQMTSITNPDNPVPSATNPTTSYTYDAYGLMLSKSQDKGGFAYTTSDYVWDMTAGIPLMLEDQSFDYVYGVGGTPVAQVTKGTSSTSGTSTQYLLTDEVGSVLNVVGSDRTNMASRRYNEYGSAVSGSNVGVSAFGFAGEYRDSTTGYIYLRARWYDPSTAQFTTVDPALATTHSQYGYTRGNPLSYRDPLGLDWIDDVNRNTQQGFLGVLNSVTMGGFGVIANNFAPGLIDNCDRGAYDWGNTVGDVASFAIPGAIGLKFLKKFDQAGSASVKSPTTWRALQEWFKDDRGSSELPGQIDRLWRAVTKQEKNDLDNSGIFRFGENGGEGKWFTRTEEQAQKYKEVAERGYPRDGKYEIVSGDMDRDLIDYTDTVDLTSEIGEGPAGVFIRADKLPFIRYNG